MGQRIDNKIFMQPCSQRYSPSEAAEDDFQAMNDENIS
jgi:hypothetical protein